MEIMVVNTLAHTLICFADLLTSLDFFKRAWLKDTMSHTVFYNILQ